MHYNLDIESTFSGSVVVLQKSLENYYGLLSLQKFT